MKAPTPLAHVCRQPLMLGLFLPIQNGGWTPSTAPRNTDWRFDLAFGLTQWLGADGHGGDMRIENTRSTLCS